MKVNGSTDPLRPEPASGKSASKGAASASAGSSASAAAAPTVRLSGMSASLSASDPGAEFDAGRVAELKQAIRDGRFEVDSGVVADKLIANVNDLFGRVH